MPLKIQMTGKSTVHKEIESLAQEGKPLKNTLPTNAAHLLEIRGNSGACSNPTCFPGKIRCLSLFNWLKARPSFKNKVTLQDILNNHFLSSISAPAVPNPKNHHSIFTIKNNFSPTEVFNFSSVCESVVAELLKSLNIRKATGCDLIPPRALKEGYPSLSRLICSLINQIITRREIPSIWKHGEVLPFLKSGDAMDKTNYRPVTILPAISKVFEKCLCPQLTSYFETIFPPTLR